MKKKIALLLAAALISVGLVVSCSDDPKPTPEPEVFYTVAFDANGGELAEGTKITVSVKAGGTVGSANWPEDPVKTTVFDYGVIEDDFNGWFDVDKKYSANEPITKDVTLVASYSPFVRPEREEEYVTALGGFTWENNPTSQRGWRSNGCDNTETDLVWEDIIEAKYLVLHTKGGAGTGWADGFGGLQVVLQSDGGGWGWDQTNINSFYYPRTATSDVFVVIDLSTLKNYSKFVKGTVGKLLISYYDGPTNSLGLGLQEAYLTNKDLSKTNSVLLASNQNKISGFATKANILSLTTPSPADVWTVNCDVNDPSGAAIASIDVVKDKGVGVRFPLDPTNADYIFLGWFDGVVPTMANSDATTEPDASWGTKYNALTKITGNTTLTAGWQLEPALDKFTIKVGTTDVEINVVDVVEYAQWGTLGFVFKVVSGGRLLISGNNWEHSILAIPVDLGSVKLKDVKKITFKLTGLTGGSTSYKDYFILAGDLTGGEVTAATKISSPGVGTGNVANGTEKEMEITIDQILVTNSGLSEASTFEFSIWANMQGAKYQIKDIVFGL